MAANEVEIERMVVRLVGDSRQYMQMLRQAGVATQTGAQHIQREATKIEGGFHAGHRAIFGMMHVMTGLTSGKPEQAMEGLGHSMLYMGGRAAGAGIAVIGLTTAVMKLNEAFADNTARAAQQGFNAIVSGAKSVRVAMAGMGLERLRTSLTEAFTQLNPSTFLERFPVLTGLRLIPENIKRLAEGKGTIGPVMLAYQDLTKAVDDYATAQEKAGRLLETAGAKRAIRAATVANLKEEIASLQEEAEARRDNASATEEELKVLVMRRRLSSVGAGDALTKELNQLKATLLDTGIGRLTEELSHAGLTAGMTADEVKIFDLATRGASEGTLQFLKTLADRNEATVEGARLLKEMTRALDDFGLSQAQAAARRAGGVGDTGLAFNLQLAERMKLQLELNKATDEFTAAMGGATKAQLAFLGASDSIAGALAATKARFDEGRRVTEQYALPQERLAQTWREMNDLLAAGTIDINTYSRSMLAAKKAAEGTAAAVRQVTNAFSAESFGRIQEYEDMLRLGSLEPGLRPAAGAAATAAGSAEAGGKQDVMIDLLRSINKNLSGPELIVAPAGL
jgi:hypothetical protein